ncbi:hypothetical protein GCM10010244_84290 [Streptomyces coeruleorubidus]|nr:hypothetical protein GCM10010244_84290 [Streptomyces bellus]
MREVKVEACHINRPGPRDRRGSLRRLLHETLRDYCRDLTTRVDAGRPATTTSRRKAQQAR